MNATVFWTVLFLCMTLLAGIRFRRISLKQATVIVIFLTFGAGFFNEFYTTAGSSNLLIALFIGLFTFAVLGIPTIVGGKILQKLSLNKKAK